MTEQTRREFMQGMSFFVGGVVSIPTALIASDELERINPFGQATLNPNSLTKDRMNQKWLASFIRQEMAESIHLVSSDYRDGRPDETTYLNVVIRNEAVMNHLKMERLILDYRVVCDSENNSKEVAERGGIVLDVFYRDEVPVRKGHKLIRLEYLPATA